MHKKPVIFIAWGGGEEKDFDCAPKGVKREGGWG